MDELEELRRQIAGLLQGGTNTITGVKIIKAVDDIALLAILKSEGILTAEEVLINNPDSLKAKYMSKINEKHPAFRNVIYTGVTLASKTRDEQRVNDNYGRINLVLKDSVLQRPNTTFTYYDTGTFIQLLREGEQIEFFKNDLLTESELIKAESENRFLEVQIRGKISLEEIEEIVFLDREPTTEERSIADRYNIPLYHKGAIVASNIPSEEAITPDNPIRSVPEPLPLPSVQSPLVEPQKLPDFVELPKVLPAPTARPALKQTDPMPSDRIPNFKEFKNIDDACDWLEAGKEIEIDFDPAYAPPTLKFCADQGNVGLWYSGVRHSNFYR